MGTMDDQRTATCHRPLKPKDCISTKLRSLGFRDDFPTSSSSFLIRFGIPSSSHYLVSTRTGCRVTFKSRSTPLREPTVAIAAYLTLGLAFFTYQPTLPHVTAYLIMCTEVYNLFSDSECKHKKYQNTFPCHVVRRCNPDDDQLLEKPVFLPAKRPKVPPGLFGCNVRKATRPVAGKCRDCNKQQLQAQQVSNSASSIQSSNHRALAQVQDSFLQVSREQRTTPQSIGSSRERAGSQGSYMEASWSSPASGSARLSSGRDRGVSHGSFGDTS
ncbi:hypothetical protein HD806DRAFT_550386 [Xylariaceae sp. AK1471]|nr:hypothetical protein HD806DRAFT_550386 [Xylariaceae sp. AK1471]